MIPVRRKPSQPIDLDLSLDSSTTATGGREQQQQQQQQRPNYNDIPPLLSTKSSGSGSIDEASSSSLSKGDDDGGDDNASKRLALHDLCDEARFINDLAWHNALYLLSVQPELCQEREPECQMNPLHVCSLTTAPIWMTRALLYTRSKQCHQEDIGGRLPLHLCVATSADLDTMQLLVQEYPASVSHKDKRGFTPLHLLLKNDQITLTLEHLRIMLGQTTDKEVVNSKPKPIRFRKGEHLDAGLQELEALKMKQEEHHESIFSDYPEDVQRSLNKISQWKRRQITKGNMQLRRTQEDMAYDYIQPASIPTPAGKLLPLHLLVRRKPDPVPTTIIHPRLLPGSTLDLCRVLIHAYPQALITRDACGRTPLLTAMLQSDSLPSEEVVETLLGLRTPQPLDISPAKFAADDTHQLPLHVAAEEMTSNYELLATICEAYPEGIEKQDLRGRTPLNLALANFRGTPVDEALLELLTNRKVAKIRDFDGNRPLDWILENPNCLVQRNDSLVFQQFLDDSIGPPKNSRDSDDLVRHLQLLPPWLRRQACAAKYVQTTLLERLTMPLNTFGVLLWGGILVALLIMLRLLLEEQKLGHVVTVYILASYLLAQQALRCMAAAFRGESYRLCLSNPWTYIHCASGALSILVAHTIDSEAGAFEVTLGSYDFSQQEALIDSFGAFATTALWLSLIGFLVEWWCGMAIAFGSAVRVLQTLFWPIITAGMVIVATSQVLYTLEDCSDDICPLSDTYTTLYWTILGEPVLTEDETLSHDAMVLLLIFSLLAIWWLLSVLVLAVSEAQSLDRRQIALQWYWEPKVTMVWTRSVKPSLSDPPSCSQRYCDQMEELWHVLTVSIKGDNYKRRELHWYSCCFRPSLRLFTPLLALVVIPIWLLLGAATLGLLWPPQVRRWLFATTMLSDPKSTPVEDRLTGSKLSQLKGEWHKFQETSMERNGQLQNDISQIKDILIRAMLEDEKPS
jgi:ankyrin repeat protein